jgi:redox-sensitive bicupin YhaK (pirin superfamily)
MEADMITVRKAADRGSVNLGWLDSKHSFSFGEYQDPEHMGFGNLRVINDDRVEPGQGFGTHPHRDMEIISYIIDGALEHKDSMGNGFVMRADDVQRMTAGSGITHSEFNHSGDAQVHFLQIWIEPAENSLEPGYEQKSFSSVEKLDQLRLVVSQDGRQGSLLIHQDANMYASVLTDGVELVHSFEAGRRGWVQVVKGDVSANGEKLGTGDGASIENASELSLKSHGDVELVLFDLA